MTRVHGLAVALVVSALLAPAVLARQAEPPQTPQSPESMGVSLKQIRRQLDTTPTLPPAPGTGLRYDFYVNVYGTRPAIEFFKDFDLSMYGPVKWGGVTHQEILNAVTPFPFQHYGMGIDLMSQFRRR
jgi:hypothetical protein